MVKQFSQTKVPGRLYRVEWTYAELGAPLKYVGHIIAESDVLVQMAYGHLSGFEMFFLGGEIQALTYDFLPPELK